MVEQPRPFLKWAGGKSKLVPEILARIPAIWDREKDLYVEPFLGGGAVFFALQPTHALLNDANLELMRAYGVVRDDAELHDALWAFELMYRDDPADAYAIIRAAFNHGRVSTTADERDQAARFLFLNKTCFNGLYRVNTSGEFNVPWGKNPNVGFPTAEHLQVCSAALQGATLFNHDVVNLAGKFDPEGALIYCDPPYVPVSKTADFTQYTADGFTYTDQLRLVIQAAYWRDAGAHVILSQAADESLVDQYRRLGFRADLVQAKRSINSKGTGRGPVGEYLIY